MGASQGKEEASGTFRLRDARVGNVDSARKGTGGEQRRSGHHIGPGIAAVALSTGSMSRWRRGLHVCSIPPIARSA